MPFDSLPTPASGSGHPGDSSPSQIVGGTGSTGSGSGTGSGRDGNRNPAARTGSGTRFSGAPLWRFTLRREKQRSLQGDVLPVQQIAIPEGFEARSNGWYTNEARGVYWRRDEQKFYRFDPRMRSYYEVSSPHPADQELRVTTDASCVHRLEKVREDRHVIVRDLTKAASALKIPIDHLPRPTALYALYSGHRPGVKGSTAEPGPSTCAEFIARNFHHSLLPRLSEYKGPWDDIAVTAALTQAFADTDAEFLARPNVSNDGCCAMIVLQIGNKAFVAHIGDSIAYIAEEGESASGTSTSSTCRVTRLTRQHQQPVSAAVDDGSAVVEETLHVNRAFGDRNLKAAGLVTSVPEVACVELKPSHRCLLLTSASLESVSTTSLEELLSQRRGKPRVACGAILQEAQTKGLQGSAAALCASFEWQALPIQAPEQPPEKKAKVDHSGQKATQVRCRQILVKHRDCKDPVDKVRGNKPVTRSLAEAERILLETLVAIEQTPGKSIFTQRCKSVSECNTCMKGGELAGDLGWMSRSQYHPNIETAAFALPIGHLSDIVESDEGVHLLWRIA